MWKIRTFYKILREINFHEFVAGIFDNLHNFAFIADQTQSLRYYGWSWCEISQLSMKKFDSIELIWPEVVKMSTWLKKLLLQLDESNAMESFLEEIYSLWATFMNFDIIGNYTKITGKGRER